MSGAFVPPAPTAPREHHRSELARFFSLYQVQKTDDEIDSIIAKYCDPDSPGLERMWTTLCNKWGKDPPPVPSYDDERKMLVNYFRRVNPSKLADVDAIIAKYSRPESEGFSVMWSKLETKYGFVTCADRLPGTTATADEQETQRVRLRDYYCSREEPKSEEDIDDAEQDDGVDEEEPLTDEEPKVVYDERLLAQAQKA